MASFRILNQAPQYLLADGSVNAGGKLEFFETDLTTPKDTWSDEAMTTLNSNPVVMDAAGRTLTDVWGDGEYGVVMMDANDVVIWTRNNVKASNAESVTIPALQDGEFLTNNGSILQWQPILQVPDPTGHADDILYSDGSLAYWGPPPAEPEIPDPDILIDSTARTLRLGVSDDNTKRLDQYVTGSAPATGTKSTSATITWPEPFDALWWASATLTITAATPSGAMVDVSITGWTPGNASSSVTVNFNVSDDDNNAAWKISNPITFVIKGEGTVEVA